MERSTIIVVIMAVIIIATVLVQVILDDKEGMIKLESDTWYYQYVIDDELYISMIEPREDPENEKILYHPKHEWKCIGGFYVPPLVTKTPNNFRMEQ